MVQTAGLRYDAALRRLVLRLAMLTNVRIISTRFGEGISTP